MFLGHLCRALFLLHFFVPAFIRRAFQYLAFVCFDNGYKYLPAQFSLQASVISCFPSFCLKITSVMSFHYCISSSAYLALLIFVL